MRQSSLMSSFVVVSLLAFYSGARLSAQPTSFVDDFDAGDLRHWRWDAVTFELEAKDSLLVIHYHRTSASWEWHNFHLILPEPISMAGAPRISLRVRSTIDTELTLKPVYSDGSNDWLPVNVPGDDRWQMYEFRLVNYRGGLLERIYFYLDGGTTVPRSGTVYFDDLLVGDAAILPQVKDLQVVSQSPAAIELSWSCDAPERVLYYNVYRGMVSRFPLDRSHRVDTTSAFGYRDLAVQPDRLYFYRVAALDTSGREGPASAEVGAHTYTGGLLPEVSVKSVNRNEVGLYEKFEVVAELQDVIFTNPYDPDQVDLRAEFTAPSGKVWTVPGFYDNFQGRDEWKVRFAPNETGLWTYRLILSNQGQTVTSGEHTFLATASPYHGWIRPSSVNPHYFVHDDGTPFYGVAFYYPWSVSNGSSGLARFQAYGGTIFGYWNIMYGNEGRIIESLVSGLGRYDQAKCGRIDQIIEWAEARNLLVMLAIWPHDLLSNTVWAHQWHNNPYKFVCDVNDFYSSEEAWRYQVKQYRYLIARWGYSRSLAIWEIVSEINGTDGWVHGRRQEATQWVARVHDFFKRNDPYGHPTTASMSGGYYWSDGYRAVDIPNVHLYEKSWPPQYPNDPLRSSLYLYHRIANQLYEDFDKPGIFGEAGYLDTYGGFQVPSEEYTILYHNALWASWAGGLAMSPFWWAFNYGPIATDQLLEQLRSFSVVVRNFPYAYRQLHPAQISVDQCDAFAMASDSSAFGWIRHRQGKTLQSYRMRLSGLVDTTYAVRWYDPWIGRTVATDYRRASDGVLELFLPAARVRRADMAFIIEVAEEGKTPWGIELSAYPDQLLTSRSDSSQLTAVIVDSMGRICSQAANPVEFTLSGPGELVGPRIRTCRFGTASIIYTPAAESGVARIVARSPGLRPDSVQILIRDHLVVDDFEEYPTETTFQSVWKVMHGTSTSLRLVERPQGIGFCLQLNYAIGNGNAPYAGVVRSLETVPAPPKGVHLWVRPDGSNRTLAILFFERGGGYWRYDLTLNGTEGRVLEIPVDDFFASGGMDSLRWERVDEMRLVVFKGGGSYGSGSVLVDDIQLLYREAASAVSARSGGPLPDKFEVVGSFPNPFNTATTILFRLPRRLQLRVDVFDVTGRKVETLWSGPLDPGEHELKWEPTTEASGVYFVLFEAAGVRAVQKCLLLK